MIRRSLTRDLELSPLPSDQVRMASVRGGREFGDADPVGIVRSTSVLFFCAAARLPLWMRTAHPQIPQTALRRAAGNRHRG